MSTLRVNNMTNVGGTGPTYAPGHIIQTVHASYSTEVTNNTSTQIDTGLAATITPKSANSKILVIVQHPAIFKGLSNADSSISMFLYRGSTYLQQFNSLNLWTGSSSQITGSTGTQFLDSPNTTSPITYKTTFLNYANAAYVVAQFRAMPSTITLMEVAG